MKNLIWNVIVEWDAVWQQSAKSLLKTIELLRLSLSWPDLCQLVASDKRDLSCRRSRTAPEMTSSRRVLTLVDNSQWYPFIKLKSCSTTVASSRSPLLSADKWQFTAVHTQCSVLSLVLFYRRKEVSREDQGIQPKDRSIQWQGNIWGFQRREGVHLRQATTEDSRHRHGKIIIIWTLFQVKTNPKLTFKSNILNFSSFLLWRLNIDNKTPWRFLLFWHFYNLDVARFLCQFWQTAEAGEWLILRNAK